MTPARNVSQAYDRAARSLDTLAVAPADGELLRRLVERLRALQQGWKQLSTAASKHDRGGYGTAQTAIGRAEKDLQVAVRDLAAAGYSVG